MLDRWVKFSFPSNSHVGHCLFCPQAYWIYHIKTPPNPTVPSSHLINKASIHAIFVNAARQGWYAPAMILSTAFNLCHHIRTNSTKWLLINGNNGVLRYEGCCVKCVGLCEWASVQHCSFPINQHISYRPPMPIEWYDIFSLKSPPQHRLVTKQSVLFTSHLQINQ